MFVGGTQCGMNKGKCFSQSSMNTLLIVGGVVLGIVVLGCVLCMCYCARSSSVNQTNQPNHFSFQRKIPSNVNNPSSSIPPRSFANPITLNVISSGNDQPSAHSNQSGGNQSNEYKQLMKYLSTTDQLLQRENCNK